MSHIVVTTAGAAATLSLDRREARPEQR